MLLPIPRIEEDLCTIKLVINGEEFEFDLVTVLVRDLFHFSEWKDWYNPADIREKLSNYNLEFLGHPDFNPERDLFPLIKSFCRGNEKLCIDYRDGNVEKYYYILNNNCFHLSRNDWFSGSYTLILVKLRSLKIGQTA